MTYLSPQLLFAQAQGLLASGRIPEAEAILRQWLLIEPANADLLHHTGLLCFQQRKLQDAEQLFREAIAVNPTSSTFHANLGEVLRLQGRTNDAIAILQHATTLNPSDPTAHYNLGVALRQCDRLAEAAAAYQKTVSLNPRDPRALNNLASTLRAQGRITEAIATFRQCLNIAPSYQVHSNLLYALWFDSAITPADILAEHARWADRWAAPLAAEIRPLNPDRRPDRRLRIGYVSPDFRQHVIALFMQPILRHHNHIEFEIFCYADVPSPDFMTNRLRADTDTWVPTTNLNDAALADRIRADRIDILIDLSAHMARHRLLTFARKPAPIQISYLAYAGTTGLPTMDYRLSDPHLDPPNTTPLGTEQVIRLPETYWCYQPQIAIPDITPRPDNAPLTFICYNNPAKITPPVIALWSRILKELPDASLRLIVGGGPLGNTHLTNAFARHGIAAERIQLHDKVQYPDYFSLYADADIALDPFPYNGGTTTLDALTMGIPVITLAGSSGMSRAGVSILTNAGLPDLIATTPDAYINLAVTLAHNPTRRRTLRQSLRQGLAASPLMNASRFTAHLESVYRSLWQKFCQ